VAERQPIGYVVTVTSKQRAPSGFDTVKIRAETCFGTDDWRRLSAGDGAKGPRLYDWAYKDYPSPEVYRELGAWMTAPG
jgi:hypothetical protein